MHLVSQLQITPIAFIGKTIQSFLNEENIETSDSMMKIYEV
jgi:hypothetical protein